ncbi:MAG: sigma-70 family RNA polymerase sigma factor [Verrucomicrobia bacterium]|nr:sigma-70 family RNA polymerase sigma factor [Verrucomicrobiota bacterium]
MNIADSELLRLYGEAGDQDAFSRLLQRHVDLVYSAALRQTLEDAGAAQEVTQAVFTDLAEKSMRLANHPCLCGWLYSSVRVAAAAYRRGEGRRRVREARYAAMTDLITPPAPPPEWNEVRAVLDDAMAELPDPDRHAVLLRFFESQSHAEIGQRLGISENAARMRISRALEALREALGRRGVVSAADALGILIARHAVTAAPAGLVTRIGARLAPGGVTRSPVVRRLPRGAVLTLGVAGVALLTVTGLLSALRFGHPPGPGATDSATSAMIPREGLNDPGTAPQGSSGEAAAVPLVPSARPLETDRFLVLTVVAKDSGAPIPNVMLDHFVRTGPGPLGSLSRKVATTRGGVVSIRVPTNVLLLDLTTRTEGFADTRLRWEPPLGQQIPTNHVLRLERGVHWGGRVVDPDGNAAVGAKVIIWRESMPSAIHGSESHEFGDISVTTDELGNWSVTRVAPEAVTRCRIVAQHPEHQPSESLALGSHPDVAAALGLQSQVLRLNPGRVVRGTVVDDLGLGVAEARVRLTQPVLRETFTSTDGSFELAGCPSGNQWIQVTASGFAPGRFALGASDDGGRIEIPLARASTLRLRVSNAAGQPVSNAWFSFSVNPWETSPKPGWPPPPPLVGFADRTDAEGRGQWTDAPTGSPRLDFFAEGYEMRFAVPVAADGVEHEVILERAATLVVHGAVRRADTSEVIPSFRLVVGYLSLDGVNGQSQVRFQENEHQWRRFEGGRFRQAVHELPVRGTGDSRVVVKIEADGFRSWISHPLSLDEGEVPLEILLEPAEELLLTVLRADGHPAAGAEVGMVAAGDRLWLAGTHFTRTRGHDPSAFRTTDVRGQVRLPRDAGTVQVLMAHPEGFARTLMESLEGTAELSLQPWSQIDVEFTGTDTAAHRVWIHPVATGNPNLELEFENAIIAADEHGRATFTTIPPGDWDVSQVRAVVASHGPTSHQPGMTTRVHLGPGESARVLLGGGYRISGRIRFPTGFRIPEHSRWIGTIHPGSPIPPTELMGDSEGLARWREQPANREAIEEARRLARFLTVTSAGEFVADSVEPGDYRFSLTLLEMAEPASTRVVQRPAHLLQVQMPVHVPADPQTGVLDLGWIEAAIVPKPEPR